MNNNTSTFPITPNHQKWAKDDASTCFNCNQPFGVLVRKHHCRKCGKLLCNRCVPNKIYNEMVCESCIMFTDSITCALTDGFEEILWFYDEKKRLWEPIQVIEVESSYQNELDKESSNVVVGRTTDGSYRTFNRSQLIKRPEITDELSAKQTIAGIFKGYLDLCKDTTLSKGSKIFFIGEDGNTKETEIESIVCKDGDLQGARLKQIQLDTMVPMEYFQPRQMLPETKLKMDGSRVTLTEKYYNLGKDLRQKVEEYLMPLYVGINNGSNEKLTRQNVQKLLVKILISSYSEMENLKKIKYNQLAETLSLSHVLNNTNEEIHEQYLDKLVLPYLQTNAHTLFSINAESIVGHVFDNDVLNKCVALDEKGQSLLKEYVRACCEVTWSMNLISPKMTLHPSVPEREDNELKSEIIVSSAFNNDEKYVNQQLPPYIWPAVVCNGQRISTIPVTDIAKNSSLLELKTEEPKIIDNKMLEDHKELEPDAVHSSVIKPTNVDISQVTNNNIIENRKESVSNNENPVPVAVASTKEDKNMDIVIASEDSGINKVINKKQTEPSNNQTVVVEDSLQKGILAPHAPLINNQDNSSIPQPQEQQPQEQKPQEQPLQEQKPSQLNPTNDHNENKEKMNNIKEEETQSNNNNKENTNKEEEEKEAKIKEVQPSAENVVALLKKEKQKKTGGKKEKKKKKKKKGKVRVVDLNNLPEIKQPLHSTSQINEKLSLQKSSKPKAGKKSTDSDLNNCESAEDNCDCSDSYSISNNNNNNSNSMNSEAESYSHCSHNNNNNNIIVTVTTIQERKQIIQVQQK